MHFVLILSLSSLLVSSLTALPTHAPLITRTRLPHIHLRPLRLIRPRTVNQALLDIAREAVKRLVDVDVALRGDLEKRDAEFVGKRLALFCGDCALFLPVALVADEDLVDAFGGVLLDVGEPCADICMGASATGILPLTIIVALRPRAQSVMFNVLSKLLWSVTSYTSRIPMAPL